MGEMDVTLEGGPASVELEPTSTGEDLVVSMPLEVVGTPVPGTPTEVDVGGVTTEV